MPRWHVCEGVQEFAQAPQLSISVIMSAQMSPHRRRSEGHTTGFEGVGLAVGVSMPVTLSEGCSVWTGVCSGDGVSTGTADVTAGVMMVWDVPGNGMEGDIPAGPLLKMRNKTASITTTAIPAPMRIFIRWSGSGCGPVVTGPVSGMTGDPV